MAVTIYYENDATLAPLQDKTIAIIGYGAQGHAHALNLRDSGLSVIVGLHEGSKSREKAEAEGLRVESVADAVKASDVIMILVPDHLQKSIYETSIEPNLTAGKTLMFAHGFAIHFGAITPPENVDVSMIAPKAPGQRVRELFQEVVRDDQIRPAIERARSIKGPVLIDFVVEPEANVYPMVAPGSSNSNMIQDPQWSPSEEDV